MTKKTLLNLWLLLVCFVVGGSCAWGADASFAPSNFSGQGTSGTGSSISATADGVTFACDKGYGTTQVRCYKDGKITISSSNTITAISFTFSGTYTGGLETSYTNLSTTSWEKTLSSQARITAVTVTYTAAASSPLASIAVDASGATTVFHVGDTFTHDGAVVTATYEDASTKNVTANATFSTPDMSTAGTKTVDVSYTENEVEKTTSYNITVKAPATLTSISLSGTYPTEFTQGGTFSSEGIVVTANYDDETTKDVTDEATFSGYDMSTVGEQTVTVSYGGKTATYDITVNAYVQPTQFDIALNNTAFGCGTGNNATEQSFTINRTVVVAGCTSSASSKTYYDAGHVRFYTDSYLKLTAPTGYNITKVVFTANGTWNGNISVNEGEYTNNTKTWEGETSQLDFSFAAQNRIASAAITLEANTPKVLSSIALSGTYPTVFHTGDAFSHEGMTVTANYEGGKTADVTADATFTGYNMANTGTQTVTVSYTENEVTKTATYDITVNAPATLTGITLSGTYPTEFEQGDAFSSEGIVVTANYNDATTADVTDEATFSGYDMAILGAQTVTVTYGGETATYDITVVEKRGTEDNPYTVAQAIAFINTLGSSTSSEEVYVHGIISKIDSYSSTYKSIQYWISDDGTTTGQMEVYSGKGLDGADFSSKDDLAVGDIVTVKGYVKKYNSTPEFDKNNVLVSFTRPVVPSISLSTTSVEATAAGKVGTITVTYNNITSVIADVVFCDAEGNAANYDWVEAEINSDNNVEYVIDENTSTETRTAYMKVYALDDDANDVYSDLITITQAGYVVDYATLPFEFDGGLSDIASTMGLTQSGLGSDYKSAPKLKFDSTGDYIILKINETPRTLSFDIKGNSFSGGMFKVQTSVDGETYTDLAAYTVLGDTQSESFNSLAANVRYIKWIYTEKSSGNVGLGNIKLNIMSVTLNASGYATFAANTPLDFSDDSKFSAWQITGVTTSAITFSQITGTVAAGTGVLLKGTASETINVPVAASGSDISDTNKLVGITSTTTIDADTYYGLSGNKFVKVGEGTVKAGKALLPASEIPTLARELTFVFENGETTGINAVNNEQTVNGAVYNLNGQRVETMKKGGLYIQNGKKFINK